MVLIRRRVVLPLLWVALAVLPLWGGFQYYLTPLAERPFMTAHEAFKPSGLVGQGLGILGTLMMIVGVSSYSLRKRWTWLHRFGKLRTWLTFHIFLCTLGPYFILLHTTFKVGNIVAIAFWSMTIVVVSGVFGRYVYVHIPKTLNGVFYSLNELRKQQAALAAQISAALEWKGGDVEGLLREMQMPAVSGFGAALFRALRFDMGRRNLGRRLEARLYEQDVTPDTVSEVIPLFLKSLTLTQQQQVMQPFQRLFGYWHVLHLPLALILLVVLLVHVGVAIAFGYTWIF